MLPKVFLNFGFFKISFDAQKGKFCVLITVVLLEGTYNNHLVQLPDHFRADQKFKHVVKGIVQMPLKH